MLKHFVSLFILYLALMGSEANAAQAHGRPLPTIPTQSPIIVLSIDGAAVRGIAQFEILMAIEEQVNQELNKRAMEENPNGPISVKRVLLTDIFDFFAGTSAGSVNVGAINIPKDPSTANLNGGTPEPKFSLSELRKMLPDTLKAAFSRSLFRDVRTLQIPGVGGLLGSKFTATPFEKLLQDLSGKARMSDTVKPVVITSYDLRGRDVINFSTYDCCSIETDDVVMYQAPGDQDFYRKDINVYLWQAVRASSAAPVFYKPLELELGGKKRALIDAGLFVMSPSLIAWAQVQHRYPNRPLIIISISSGALLEAREVQATGATAGSVPKVLQPTIETALEGQQALTDMLMQKIGRIMYHRLSFIVRNKDFDDTSEKNIKDLMAAAQVTIKSPDFRKAIKDIVDGILERRQKKDFQPFTCDAKKKFKENLMQTSAATVDRKNAFEGKLQPATDQMARVRAQGNVVPFGASPEDQKLQAQAVKAKQDCLGLLGQGKIDSAKWKEDHCENAIPKDELCKTGRERLKSIATELTNKNCNKLIKPKGCSSILDQKKSLENHFSSMQCPIAAS